MIPARASGKIPATRRRPESLRDRIFTAIASCDKIMPAGLPQWKTAFFSWLPLRVRNVRSDTHDPRRLRKDQGRGGAPRAGGNAGRLQARRRGAAKGTSAKTPNTTAPANRKGCSRPRSICCATSWPEPRSSTPRSSPKGKSSSDRRWWSRISTSTMRRRFNSSGQGGRLRRGQDSGHQPARPGAHGQKDRRQSRDRSSQGQDAIQDSRHQV